MKMCQIQAYKKGLNVCINIVIVNCAYLYEQLLKWTFRPSKHPFLQNIRYPDPDSKGSFVLPHKQ
jgi:hypothetical protein